MKQKWSSHQHKPDLVADTLNSAANDLTATVKLLALIVAKKVNRQTVM